MGNKEKGVTSIRIDRDVYEKFKEFCSERGLFPPKQISFLLAGLMKNPGNFDMIKEGWVILKEMKRVEHIVDIKKPDIEDRNK